MKWGHSSSTATANIKTPERQQLQAIWSWKVRGRRLNGWQFPWDATQVFSWLTIPLVGGLTICVALPLPGFPIFPVLVLLFFIWNAVWVLFLTTVDPAPEGKHIRPAKFERNEEHQHVIEKGYCCVCRTKAPEGTKHCRHCNKCVTGYDHHCKWLNTCVGLRNYRMFVVLVASLTAMSLVFCIMFFTAVLVFVVRMAGGEAEPFLSKWTWFDPVAWCVLCVLAIFCHLLVFGFTAHLLNFHFMLWRHGLTTISYVQQKRQRDAKNSEKKLSAREQPIPTIDGSIGV